MGILGSPRLAAGLRDAGTAKHDDGGNNAAFFQNHVGLQELELQAHRPQLALEHEVGISEGEPVDRRHGLRC